MIQVTNDKGRKFNVKVLFKGDTYGLNKCLTHEKEDPLVEFYDATYAGAEDFDPEGQFVSRYFVDTILGEDKWGVLVLVVLTWMEAFQSGPSMRKQWISLESIYGYKRDYLKLLKIGGNYETF